MCEGRRGRGKGGEAWGGEERPGEGRRGLGRGGEAWGGEERPGEEDKVVGMQLHVYIHRAIEPCACVCGRDMQILYL